MLYIKAMSSSLVPAVCTNLLIHQDYIRQISPARCKLLEYIHTATTDSVIAMEHPFSGILQELSAISLRGESANIIPYTKVFGHPQSRH